MGECSAYSSLQAGSWVKFAAWPTNWRPVADRLLPRGPKVNSHMAGAVDDSTINIVEVIIIIITVIIIYCSDKAGRAYPGGDVDEINMWL